MSSACTNPLAASCPPPPYPPPPPPPTHTHTPLPLQEYEGRLRVVKVETDPSPKLVEKYNVRVCVGGGAGGWGGGTGLHSGLAYFGTLWPGHTLTSAACPPACTRTRRLHPQVYGLPCLILFRGGEPVEGSQREGAIAKKALVTYLAGFGVEPSAATATA